MIAKEITRDGSPGPAQMRVTFSLPATIWADRVRLVGDFNNWDATETPLRQDDTGWHVTLHLPTNRTYHYRYLLDDTQWVNDWNADGFCAGLDGLDMSVVCTALPATLEASELERTVGDVYHWADMTDAISARKQAA